MSSKFFFSSRRRHTRWNCDWSSDVCSSDLVDGLYIFSSAGAEEILGLAPEEIRGAHYSAHVHEDDRALVEAALRSRSEERRVGKECRSREWGDQDKKQLEGRADRGGIQIHS